MEVILDIEIKFITCLFTQAFIDSLARLGISGVNVASRKAASLLSSGIFFSRKFNWVSVMRVRPLRTI